MEEVIKKLATALKNDEGYRQSWVANIAMSYIDNEHWYRVKHNKVDKYLNSVDKQIIANDAAEYFLKQLLK